MDEEELFDFDYTMEESTDELLDKILDHYFNNINPQCLEKTICECVKYENCFECRKGDKNNDKW